MAKQSKPGKKDEFTFTEIGKIFEDIAKTTSIMVEKNDKPADLIGTGNYMLNACISASLFGGIQSNRITAFAGDTGTGKSFLCYNLAREAQKKGYNVIYIDTEFSIERSQLPAYGIDSSPERFILIRSNKVEDIKMMLAQLLNQLKEKKLAGKEVAKCIMFLDSAGQLASNKEVADAIAGNDKADMTRAKAMGSLFRIVNADLGYLNIPFVVTNHTYETMEMFSTTTMKGGKSLYYTASTIAFLSKAKLKTGEEDDMDIGQSGIVVTAKCIKNRMAKLKKIKFEISFEKGSNPYAGLEAFCRPEFFDQIGIAQGKYELDKETGAMEFRPGGNRWFVKHLDKSVTTKQLNTKEVFTQEVLLKMEPIVNNYFKYKSMEELENAEKEFSKIIGDDVDEDAFGADADEVSGEDLFN